MATCTFFHIRAAGRPVRSLHLQCPAGEVLGSVTVGVNDGARIGIVGRNGEGKSSLLGLLTGLANRWLELSEMVG